ncbi:myrosinase 1-like [Daktulosphaira vitifoliae]|uniref:myrosinase 1-like n=1 Tax=Daktulosphaira vitifoliae TaxID=58002 RepID=UPI0021AAA240|nr:myrosinase 1-like [Daktulosphaira vitifoliae]XP_050532047.1 myrosinase 1-like [Daktulosphaira vitifoliae]
MSSDNKFPENFLFGASSSAYQIEGAWNEDGKSKSIWDYRYHNEITDLKKNKHKYFSIRPGSHKYHHHLIKNSDIKFVGFHNDHLIFEDLSIDKHFTSGVEDDGLTSGDVTCDSYHKFEEDIKILKKLGVQVYRFSISWTRVLPRGHDTSPNPAGVEYYHKIIDLLLENDITPVVTIYHWDLPQSIQVLGGWANNNISRYFENYANFLFKTYGDKVKYWTTINEPRMASEGYGGNYGHAPQLGKNYGGLGDYMAIHNLLLAHAKAYRLYEKNYKSTQQGQICICLDILWAFPKDPNSEDDKKSAQLFLESNVGLFIEPLVTGKIPKAYLDSIIDTNQQRRINVWRMIQFTEEEKELLIGSYDFLSVNYYHSLFISALPEDKVTDPDLDLKTVDQRSIVPNWFDPVDQNDTIIGFRNIMNWLNKKLGQISHIRKPKFFISENGITDDATNDPTYKEKINYHYDIIKETKNLIDSGIDIFGYCVWSLMDSFEWSESSPKYGIYKVDFKDPNRPRTPKPQVVEFFQDVFLHKELKDTRPN